MHASFMEGSKLGHTRLFLVYEQYCPATPNIVQFIETQVVVQRYTLFIDTQYVHYNVVPTFV